MTTSKTASKTASNSLSNATGGERLQKIIAQAGITSRRDAEELIRDGQVTVNGKTAKLGDKATLGKDAIKVKGKLIQSAVNKVYYLFYKPKNVIAMIAEDEEGRPTMKDFLHRIKERVFAIGRMDFTGEGAILLTNDGELAQRMQKATEIIRRYHVKVDRMPTSEELAKIARGGRIEGRSMQPHHVRVVESYTKNALIEISFEGMGQIEIKQYFENKGFFPEKIARVGIGHLNAQGIAPGAFKRIEASSIEALFVQPELAKKQIERMVAKKSVKTKVLADTIADASPGKKIMGRDSRTTSTQEPRTPLARAQKVRPAREGRPGRSDFKSEYAPRVSESRGHTDRSLGRVGAEVRPARAGFGPKAASKVAPKSASPRFKSQSRVSKSR